MYVYIYILYIYYMHFGVSLVAQMVKNVGDLSLIPRLGRSAGGGHGNPLQYSAGRIPWTEELNGLESMGHKESDTTERLSSHTHMYLSFSYSFISNRIVFSMLSFFGLFIWFMGFSWLVYWSGLLFPLLLFLGGLI